MARVSGVQLVGYTKQDDKVKEGSGEVDAMSTNIKTARAGGPRSVWCV